MSTHSTKFFLIQLSKRGFISLITSSFLNLSSQGTTTQHTGGNNPAHSSNTGLQKTVPNRQMTSVSSNETEHISATFPTANNSTSLRISSFICHSSSSNSSSSSNNRNTTTSSLGSTLRLRCHSRRPL